MDTPNPLRFEDDEPSANFWTNVYDDDAREHVVVGYAAASAEDALTLLLRDHPDLGQERFPYTAAHFTTCWDRARKWADDENDYLRCDELASARFEDMAYGSRNDY